MRYSKIYFTLIVILGLVSFSCSDLQQDITPPSKVSVHGVSVYNPSSSTYHGLTVKEKTLESCKQCHASDFSGGTAQVNCNSCHPAVKIHQSDINNPTSAGFHGKYIASINWNVTQCRQCHGSNYTGGVASPTCNSCHKNPGGPEACNTCHGNFLDATSIAPPTDIARNVDTKFPGVGAHSAHLTSGKVGIVKCSECHNVPTALNSVGHIDNTARAEVVFKQYDYVVGSSTYDFSTYKCNNNYCHGSFAFSKANSTYPDTYTADKIEGNNYQPIWNKVDNTQAACGTCHGSSSSNPLPKGHIDYGSGLKGCATCHIGVVDQYGKIIDATKHIDGKINVFEN